ncbi:MAG: TolC family protein [Bacteroidetes bacterium]|nr:TolC family protein [Bacteroidota bacterium]
MSIKQNYMKFILMMLLCVSCIAISNAQEEYLSADDAVQYALEHNYNVQAAENAKAIAENNTSSFNTGQLPTVSASAGTNYNFNRVTNKINDNVEKENSNSFPFSAGVSVNYVLYDASRKLNIEQLNERVDMSDLQLRQTVESLLAGLLINYYKVAQLEQDVSVKKDNFDISKRNLTRAEYAFDYGVTNKLGVLNNEVNVNNDSIAYQIALVEFANAKRDLNVLMGRDASVDFVTDTTISFISDISLDQLRVDALQNNVFIQMADQSISIDQLSIDLARSGWMPSLSTSGGYNWRQQFFVSSPTEYLGNNGFQGGLNMSWNIFDGGRTKTAVENSKIAIESTRLYKDEIIRQIDRDILNGWQVYENALLIVESQRKNIETSQSNFERTNEKYKLGNATITTLREAQTNLLNTRLGLVQAIYSAKVFEIQLMQLAGKLTGN